MTLRRLEVRLDFGLDQRGTVVQPRPVGTLAEDGTTIAFEYAAEFLAAPLPVSPFHLLARPGLFRHDDRDFDRLPGVIADALPDGFGRLIQDRAFEAAGIPRVALTPLDRLAALGSAAMGALTFHPATPIDGDAIEDAWPLDLDALASQGERLLEGSPEDVLPSLLAAGGSPGGARPKVVAGVHPDGRLIAGSNTGAVTGRTAELPSGFQPWLIKFAAREDVSAFGPDSGAVEMGWWHMARAAGLTVPDARLFQASTGSRWFGVERFDRHGPGGRGRLHLHTLSGLLHASHRQPSLDYEALLQVTAQLTRDMREVMQAFRRMAFNAFAHNRDDHGKNIAFLMDDTGAWRLAPAYDLTFSAGIAGHHSTAFLGESLRPSSATLMRLGVNTGLARKDVAIVLDEVANAVASWPDVARALDIDPRVAGRIEPTLSAVRHAFGGARPR